MDARVHGGLNSTPVVHAEAETDMPGHELILKKAPGRNGRHCGRASGLVRLHSAMQRDRIDVRRQKTIQRDLADRQFTIDPALLGRITLAVGR